ncbi:MAG TPA: 5-dehydro-2-deoxygluconokinase [Steroidobacteraceae bacterium]|jgi:5-dehydro-2-deoxygluconokinase|nr:5-dehydro-2-deoxygluconokinase [Steroidobacteraceae bacterium]
MTPELDTTRRFAAIVLGRAGMDLYPMPDGAETETAETFAAEVGGSAANIAVAIARQGLPVALLGTLSDDSVGRFVRTHLERYSVDTSRCRAVGGTARTSLAICETRPLDSETVFYRNGAVDLELRREDFDASFIRSASALVVTGTALAAEPSRTAALEALGQARASGTLSILDVDYRPVSWPSVEETTRVVGEAARLSDVIVGNDEEFAVLAGGRWSPLEAASEYARNGCRFVVLKKGEAGSITFTAGASFETGIVAVEVKKPFGAGDAFLGNLIAALRAGAALETAVSRATAAAAYVVSRRGCAFAMPTSSQLESFIKSHSSR